MNDEVFDLDELSYVDAGIGYAPVELTDAQFNIDQAKKTTATREIRNCRVYDARKIRDDLSLDRQGFIMVKHSTKFADERNLLALQAGYPDELVEVVRGLSKASWVLPKRVDIVLRASAPATDRAGTASSAHADYTRRSLLEQAQLVLEANGQGGRAFRRVGVYQTWRALTPPPQDRPLAICDARTVGDADRAVMKSVIGREDDPTKVFETTLARYSPNHRWFYFSNMILDEVIVFRGADSDPEHNLNVFHVGFLDESDGLGKVPRESIESRFFCFYE